MVITAFGIAAFLLSPFGLIYWLITGRGEAPARRGRRIIGALCAVQSLASVAYFALLFTSFPEGLGV